MTKPLTFACTAALLTVCGGRELEAETDGESSSSTSDSDSETVSDSDVSVTMTTTMTTAMTMTTDPATTDATSTDPVTTDPDTSGNPETTGSPSNSCCEVHGDPGCEEADVATCVCKASPDCCVFEWADNCVEAAMTDCAATCMGTEESSGSETTGNPGDACDEIVELEYLAEDAVLDGGWVLVESMSKPGMMVASNQGQDPTGTVTWDIEIPCDDQWHIWIRGYNAGPNDSFFARQDGGPDPAPIFEVECTQDNAFGYLWTELNWRDPEMGMACEYVENPWLADWATGAHTFQLEYRESPAVARIIVTNDDAFVPPP